VRRPAASTRTLWNVMVGKRSMSKKSALRRCLSRIWMPVSSEAASIVRVIRAPAGRLGSASTSPLKRPKWPSAFMSREVARKLISLASGWMRKRSGSAAGTAVVPSIASSSAPSASRRAMEARRTRLVSLRSPRGRSLSRAAASPDGTNQRGAGGTPV